MLEPEIAYFVCFISIMRKMNDLIQECAWVKGHSGGHI